MAAPGRPDGHSPGRVLRVILLWQLLSFGLRMHRLRASTFGSLLLLGVVCASACTVAPAPSEPSTFWDGGPGDTAANPGSSSGAGGSSSSSGGSLTSDAASACEPGNVASYHPDAYHPASGPWQGLCVPGAGGDPIKLFYDQCLGAEASSDACNQFREANAACVACILTPDTAAKYGPILDHGTFVTANVAGCIELAGDQEPDASEVPCAKAVQALAGCELAACEANCAVHDAASLTAYDTCATDAEEGGCEPYATAVTCANSEGEASALGAACVADFQTFYDVVVPAFCGVGPVAEAGAVPPTPADGGSNTLDASHE
jgi:hypothetical protein